MGRKGGTEKRERNATRRETRERSPEGEAPKEKP
jgi:hypothetical protein